MGPHTTTIRPARRAPSPAAADWNLPQVSVVICTLDEHEAIGGVLEALSADLADVFHEIIVVDDSADDRTARAVLDVAMRRPAIRLLKRDGVGGLASAAIAGWDSARGATLAVMDGDGQHDPRLIGAMLRKMAKGEPDLVVASRYLDGAGSGLSGVRHAISRGGVNLAGALLGLRLADPMSGCFLMTRDWYQAVRPRLSGVGFKILVDVVASGQRRPAAVQIPTALLPRAGGESKLDLRVAFDLIGLLAEKRTNGVLSARLFQFLAVGVSGLVVHLGVLGATQAADMAFWSGQTIAILIAMSWNFALNNVLTFRDKRLRGAALWRGLLSFYAACLGGALINDLAGAGLNAIGASWALAGAGGAVLGALWNYHASRRVTWRDEADHAENDAAEAAAPLAGESRA
ncbi:glycosyltransferase [Caulobacter hibisci]|uniref:Glycosyltransferase n=1 Tax=Caulobacter hibisci TaxID=2035993 RepID=A0ABS0T0N8_9CAUL|nr:glycosyltransferase [Caulobacter hibisci]MBI1685433.1 glycosyltransferase [Caulobacter hibisci]